MHCITCDTTTEVSIIDNTYLTPEILLLSVILNKCYVCSLLTMLLFSIIYPHIDGHASKEANCIFIRKKVILASLEIMDRIYSKLKNNVIPFTV